MYKKELLKNIVFPLGEINEDIPAILKLFDRAKKVINIGKPVYDYIKYEGVEEAGCR
ncbi:hypothetical protein ACXO23_08575 [Lactobacillus delbrueckii subsp. bulgaricus]